MLTKHSTQDLANKGRDQAFNWVFSGCQKEEEFYFQKAALVIRMRLQGGHRMTRLLYDNIHGQPLTQLSPSAEDVENLISVKLKGFT